MTKRARTTMADGKSTDSVRIERVLDAGADRVWLMWTDPQHFAEWYGPEGATVHVAKMDVTVGGPRLVRMDVNTPGGARQMWLASEHREVVDGKRLVYTESMADEAGNVLTPSQMGMPDDHPVTTEVVVELEDLGGRTKMFHDPHWCSTRFPWCSRLEHGLRQARGATRRGQSLRPDSTRQPAVPPSVPGGSEDSREMWRRPTTSRWVCR